MWGNMKRRTPSPSREEKEAAVRLGDIGSRSNATAMLTEEGPLFLPVRTKEPHGPRPPGLGFVHGRRISSGTVSNRPTSFRTYSPLTLDDIIQDSANPDTVGPGSGWTTRLYIECVGQRRGSLVLTGALGLPLTKTLKFLVKV